MWTTTPESDDDDLRRLASTHRARAIDEVARRHVGGLMRHATSLLRDPDEAADLVQETLIRAMREPRLFDEGFQIRAWLHRVVTNLAFNHDRNRRRRGTLLATRYTFETDIPSADRRIEQTQELAAFDATLGRLTEAHQTILEMRYVDDLSYAEIADALEVKMGTVMSRLSRAREQFVRHAAAR